MGFKESWSFFPVIVYKFSVLSQILPFLTALIAAMFWIKPLPNREDV
jgi:hypothetical protein